MAGDPARNRGMWVWDTDSLLHDAGEIAQLVKACTAAGVTNVFLYLDPSAYADSARELGILLGALGSFGVRSWGMEGSRNFFSDIDGPQGVYDALDALIKYNEQASPAQRFIGFQSDIEPVGGKQPDTFHRGKANSDLSTESGSGVWKCTEAQDRAAMMRDWLDMHEVLRERTHSAGLLLGAALHPWLGTYMGEALVVEYGGVSKTVMHHFFDLLDTYNVMSYNTFTDIVVEQMQEVLESAPSSIQVFAGIETHPLEDEPDADISYGDLDPKPTRAAVLRDLATLDDSLCMFPAYAGVNIHDWQGGWQDL